MGFGDVDITLAAVVAGTVVKLTGLAIVAKNRKARFERVGTVSALYMYPVKSCGVTSTQEATCTDVGLSNDGLTDRHWMVLGANDKILTLKEVPKLTQVRSSSNGQFISIQAPGMPTLNLLKEPKLKHAKPFNFSKQNIPIIDCGEAAAKWISDYIGSPAKIVFSCSQLGTRDAFERKRKWSNTARPGDVTVFSYLTSYLVTSEASLRKINSDLPEPVSMVCFRPNIVIDNEIPFDEDNWTEIRIGEKALMHRVEPCIRCIITTTNPDTGVRDEKRQPLELLRKFRCKPPYGQAPVFGSYMSLDLPGQVRVGDPVYAIRNSQ